MSSTTLTLAALATSAVPNLEVLGARPHSADGAGLFTAVVISTPDGERIIRVPRTPAAEVRQSAEILGLTALTEAARAELPFEAPRVLGMTRAGDSRAVVATYLAGGRITVADLTGEDLLLEPLSEALGAIHSLPQTLIREGGLAARTAADVRAQAARLVDRAAATGLLPQTVHDRWTEILASRATWDFEPLVVHGSLDEDQLRITDSRVTGVLGWDELSTGDPAADFAWLMSDVDVADAVLARYWRRQSAGAIAQFRARARFHYELQLAEWLLHGVESHDEATVDDAVSMFDNLVDQLVSLTGPVPSIAQLTEEEAKQVLDEVPEIIDYRSETVEFEALDEDRMFAAEDDFGENGTGEDGSESDSPDRAPLA